MHYLAMIIILVATSLGLATSCSSGDTPSPDGDIVDPGGPGEPKPPFEAGNNYALLDGDAIGNGSTPNTDLVKEVPITITTVEPGFEIGAARIARSSLTSDSTRMGVLVTNNNSDGRCLVSLRFLSFRDGAGNEVAIDDRSFADGSVGAFDNSTTQTCLAAGETTWLTSIVSASFDQIELIVAEELVGDRNDLGAPPCHVIPQSYSATAGSIFLSGLDVMVLNDGSADCYIEAIGHTGILLDDNDEFLWYVTPSLNPSGTLIAPGETLTLSDNYVAFDGSATRIAFRIDFDM